MSIELICPSCKNDVTLSEDYVQCIDCNNNYSITDGIAQLFMPTNWKESKKDVTDIVHQFYEDTPFPNYEDMEGINDLVTKSEMGYYAKFINEQTPFNVNVLEVGCGTGQLANYLGLAKRNVVGTDMCLNSLRLAEAFRHKHNISNTKFYQMNLFNPIFVENSFHLVICQGVLHHTSDPYLGFQTISKLVKKGGYIIIGLYNKYGRLITDARRFFFRITGDSLKFIDPRLKKTDRGILKRESWFNDQYKHPHESKHTIDEVLNWFDSNDFEFINSIPKSKPFMPFTINEKLFNPIPKGNYLDHLIVQLNSIIDGYKEGGLFIMIGKKR
jgi:2-polyprenyl-3-methyl-5-hydroxy-6-metoxy-1,4-benzoquinol methylase